MSKNCATKQSVRASLLSYLDDFARWGDECAFVSPRGYRRERWSYRRLADTAYRFARELQARNVAKGDAVLLWSENCAEWVAAFFGCALCGVIAVPVDDAASPAFVQRIAASVRTKLALCHANRAQALPGVSTIDPAELLAAVSHHSAEPFRPTAVEPPDTLEIVFTSGTTAEPKGVVLTHANVLANLTPLETEIGKYLKYERFVHPIRFLNLLPLSHVFGQFLGIFLPPLMGGTVLFANTLNPAEIIATIRRERISVLVAVPRMIDSLRQKIERNLASPASGSAAKLDFDRRYAIAPQQRYLRRWWTFRDVHRQFGWKFWAMISGGAALDRDTEEFWRRLGYAVVQGYGLTETTSLISVNHPFHMSHGSIGKVLPGRELKLADDGEILVRGSGVAAGYWNGETLKPVAGEAGWYGTGDLGALDEHGNLYFKGRKKDVIVTPAGMNIFPEDLEAALRQQKEIRDCVVVGVERNGNAEPCAVLILRDPAHTMSRTGELVAATNQTLAEYQRMHTWHVWPEEDFPRTSTQKPRRNLIRETVEAALQAGRGGDADQSPEGRHTAASSVLSELLSRMKGRSVELGSGKMDLDADLGLTSLERVELMSAIEDRYQVDLSETSFAAATSVHDVETLLQSGLGRSEIGARSPGEETLTARRKFHYPRWSLRWPTTWVRLFAHYVLVRPAVMLLGWPRVVGRANLGGVAGPFLVISNHISDVDVGFIQFALPRRIGRRLATATGGEALELLRSPAPGRGWVGHVYDRVQWTLGVALLNLFPLPRQSGFRKSFAYAGEAVDRGYSVLVFPEGRHTESGELLPFRSGIGLLAQNLGIPVVPMRIDGLFDIKKIGRRFAAPVRIQVRIGKPLQFTRDCAPQEIAEELQAVVRDL
jgi:long-chain acyl-CoA synthetase